MAGSRIVLLRVGIVLATACFSMSAGSGAALTGSAFAATYEGKPVPIGHGSARVVVRTDAAGEPVSVAVKLSGDALDGLPTTLNGETSEGQWEYVLPMPTDGPKTGYREVFVDWNPQGHPPPDIYTVPHFDFHFYAIGADEVAQVTFTGATDPAINVSDNGLVPPDYQVVPDTHVNKMGVHAIDMTGPEFHGKPFTSTFIYGYYKGRLIFVEPMVTRAFLLTKPDVTHRAKVPAHYSVSGYYPGSYGVRYEPGGNDYLVELGSLKRWE